MATTGPITTTTSAGSVTILRKITVQVTGNGGGAIRVAHGFSNTTPTFVLPGFSYSGTSTSAGPIVQLDNSNSFGQGATVWADQTYVYLTVSGPGTFDVLIGAG